MAITKKAQITGAREDGMKKGILSTINEIVFGKQ